MLFWSVRVPERYFLRERCSTIEIWKLNEKLSCVGGPEIRVSNTVIIICLNCFWNLQQFTFIQIPVIHQFILPKQKPTDRPGGIEYGLMCDCAIVRKVDSPKTIYYRCLPGLSILNGFSTWSSSNIDQRHQPLGADASAMWIVVLWGEAVKRKSLKTRNS